MADKKISNFNDEFLLHLMKIFSASTSIYMQGNNQAIKIFIEKYRELLGIKPGTVLCKESPFKLHGPIERNETACHMVGTGLTGLCKLMLSHGLSWNWDIFKHPRIKECLKVTVDQKKDLFLYIKHPLGNCRRPNCNGNPKCIYQHPNGFFDPVIKYDKKEE